MTRVLIVDDKEDNLYYLRALLEGHGCTVDSARDGAEALIKARRLPPDLVISDLLMPVMDGFTLLRNWKADLRLCQIPFVVYTATYTHPEDEHLSLNLGADAFILKPAEPVDFMRRIRKVLANGGAAMPAPQPAGWPGDEAALLKPYNEALVRKLEEKTRQLEDANSDLRKDVSERQRINEALQRQQADLAESQLQFRSLFENMLDGYAYCQTHFEQDRLVDVTYLEVNGAFERLTGLKDVAGKRISDVVPGFRTANPELFDMCGRVALTQTPEKSEMLVAALGAWVSVAVYSRDRDHFVAVFDNITTRKAVEETLRSGLEEFRTLAEAMPQIVWITRADGGNVYFNRHWMEYTGLTLEQSLGDGWNTPFHPDDLPRAKEAWRHATATLSAYSIESRLRRADGVYRWWLVRGVPQRDAGGRILKWFGTCTDIHDLKVADLEILRVNRALKMLSSTNEALIREKQEPALLRDACRIAVEVGGYRMAWIGYAQDDEGRSVRLMAHAGAEEGYFSEITVNWNEHDPRGRGPAGRAIRAGRAVVRDDVAQDPAFLPFLAFAQRRGYRGNICLPLRDATHTFGVLGLFSADVHQTSAEELKLLQEMADDLAFGIGNLHTQAERARLDNQVREQAALLDIAHEAIMVKDLDGRIVYWNKGAERTYGWCAAEARGRQVDELLHTDDPAFLEARATLLAHGEWSGEQVRHARDGRAIVVEASWTLVRDEQGQPRSILAINWDITARRLLEQQFQQAQKMEAIGRLAGGVAHDFNNLLTVILGFCELLLADRNPDDPRQADIAEIQKAGTRAAGLTRQLLAFSRKQIIEPTRLDLNVVVAEMQPMLERLIGEDVQIVLQLGTDLAAVKADRGQVEQIVLNLAVNARDAMPKGGTLTIHTANIELDEHCTASHLAAKPGPYVGLTVTDTGAGMTPEVQARLFEPFFTTKEVGKGTGLGLATVHGIVMRNGGSIDVHSDVGRGTSFKVYFPQDDSAAPVADAAASAARPHAGAETVLLVEDADGLRALVERLLRRQGYTVLSAANAAAARRLFDEHPAIDVLLTDVVMPGASGPELTTALIKQRPSLKVVYMSGYTEDAIVHHGVLDPGITFLHKPFTADTLARKIREVLDR